MKLFFKSSSSDSRYKASISILFLCLFFILSCDNYVIDKDRFFELYTEILKVRIEPIEIDSANVKVKELFLKFNYTEENFRRDFLSLAENENKDGSFVKKIDSLRQEIYNQRLEKRHINDSSFTGQNRFTGSDSTSKQD